MATPAREPSPSLIGRLLEHTWQVEPALRETLTSIPAGARICDLGAGGRRVRPDVIAVDVAAGPGVDVVADIHHVPLPDASFDLVICTGTLNLCRSPEQVLAEIHRLLVPGGLLHLEVGMFQPYNPEPEDYWRWTRAGLRLLHQRAGFEEVRSGAHIGPMSALASSAIYVTSSLFAGPSLPMKAARGAAHAVFGPVKYLDRLIPKERRENGPLAYGLFYVARKPERPAGA